MKKALNKVQHYLPLIKSLRKLRTEGISTLTNSIQHSIRDSLQCNQARKIKDIQIGKAKVKLYYLEDNMRGMPGWRTQLSTQTLGFGLSGGLRVMR